MALKWWEKTVEYFFILKCFERGKLKLAPLDGKEEGAGDLIFSNIEDNNYILIEFKRNKDYLNSEKKKFNDYDTAWSELHHEDNHHFIIFGYENSYNELELDYRTYFSAKDYIEFDDLFHMGTDKNTFKIYIEKLLSYKMTPLDPDGTGTGGLNLDSYGLVASVNNDNEILECKSLSEFASQELNMNLNHTLEHNYESSSPGFGNYM